DVVIAAAFEVTDEHVERGDALDTQRLFLLGQHGSSRGWQKGAVHREATRSGEEDFALRSSARRNTPATSRTAGSSTSARWSASIAWTSRRSTKRRQPHARLCRGSRSRRRPEVMRVTSPGNDRAIET